MAKEAFYATLNVLAAQVDDLETVRIASDNRYRMLATSVEDKDGILRGMNLGVDDPQVKRLQLVVTGMKELEEKAIKNLQKYMRDSAWRTWMDEARGVGAKQLARLLASVGDPYWHPVHDRPRRVTELWAYAGMHNVRVGADGKFDAKGDYFAAPRRQRGVQGNWSEEARKRVWLIASSCMKQPDGTRYRDVYTAAREKYEEAVHRVACVRCGPSGSPKPVGSSLSLGHQDGRARRAVAKEILKDLWVESRFQHGDEDPDGEDARVRARRQLVSA